MNNSTNLNNDKILLDALQRGEPQAFEDMYRNYYKMVANFVTTNSGSEDDARDLFQEVLLKFYEKLRAGNFKLTSKLSSFLFSVARNLWLYKLRKGKNHPELSISEDGNIVIPDDGAAVIEQKKEDEKRYKLIANKLKELKEDCQKIIRDHFKNGKNLKELAEEMGYTYGFIRVKKNRCLNKYRELVFNAL